MARPLPRFSCIALCALAAAGCASSAARSFAPADPLAPPSFRGLGASGVASACDEVLAEAARRRAAIVAVADGARDEHNTLVALDALGERLGRFGSSVYLLANAHPDKALRDACQKAATRVEEYGNSLSLDRDLFRAVKAFAATAQARGLSAESARFLRETLREYRRSGLDLPDEKLARVRVLLDALTQRTMAFQRNIDEDARVLELAPADCDGMPAAWLDARRTAGGKIRVDLTTPSYQPFMQQCRVPESRRRLMTLYYDRARDKNSALLSEILGLRAELATLLGYKTYADYVLEKRMAENPEKVWGFLGDLRARLAPIAARDRAQLSALKREVEGHGELAAWDPQFYLNLARKRQHALDAEQLRPYFPVRGVIDGLFGVCRSLFGIEFRRVADADVWHPSVELLEVTRDGKLVGRLYLDLHPRPGKYGHAAQFDFVAGRRLPDGRYQTPAAALLCNFPTPSAADPGLLRHDDVETLFHEFGHALHTLLTRARFASFAGTSVARDFVEMPSQILENWAFEPEVLRSFARHYKTGEAIPAELVKRIAAARDFAAGYLKSVQLFYGTFDMTLHHRGPGGSSPAALYHRQRAEITGVPSIPGTSPEAGFGHLMGYAAGYYGYLWAEVYAQDGFEVFRKNGLLDRATGRRFEECILAPGGGVEPLRLLNDFLGRDPDSAAFLRGLGLGGR